ncbi:MAG: glycosyltransferase [Phycisphaerae bacterium]|nr:glycosyltransferase [Phycisphaerae bacterium]
MHVQLFAYYFPPDGGAGTQRPASFARHFPSLGPSLGASCTVITRTPPAKRNYWEPLDATLVEAVERASRVVRTPPTTGGLDAWLTAAECVGEEEIRRQRPDVLLLTMSPFALWRVGASLADRHGIPVVFDLRDPWALDGWQSYRTWFHWRRERSEMRRMLRRADGVVANTPESRKLFLALEPSLRPERVTVVTNGWERDAFPLPTPRVVPGDTMRIVFTGSFLSRPLYPGSSLRERVGAWLRYVPEPIEASGRTPLHLLQALKDLRDRGLASGRETRLIVVGQKDEWTTRCVNESGVADAVEFAGYLSHAESVRAIREADALFLPLHGLPSGVRSRIVPGKAYEYLATGRPILGALPEGDAREILEGSGRAFIADPCDRVQLATALDRLHAAWRKGAFIESSAGAEIAMYERRSLAERLVEFLHGLVPASAA